jgi:glyoxylase-like metal-dependent hydrolase (beta-lactamase superfamily II)
MNRVRAPLCLFSLLALIPAALTAQTAPSYQIHAIRYATVPDFRVASLMRGADPAEHMDIAMVFWLIRGGDHTILFDTGFHRSVWFDRFTVTGYLSPDSAIVLAGVQPDDVTDVIISHAHWDHMGGLDLFPNATIWIQREEFVYYTGQAWQDGGRGGGADPDDLLELVRRNTAGQVRLVDGDDVEILPGIRVFTGARHTFASQYVLVQGSPAYLLASDNAYLYRNLDEHRPVATFTPADSSANLAALSRMLELAGSADYVVPGHDPAQFDRFPKEAGDGGGGRVARIR